MQCFNRMKHLGQLNQIDFKITDKESTEILTTVVPIRFELEGV